jgi:hypothetical protein
VTAKVGPVGELQPRMVERVMRQIAPQRHVVEQLGLAVRGQNGTRVHQAAVQRRRGRAPRERFQFIEDQNRDVAPSALRRRIGR